MCADIFFSSTGGWISGGCSPSGWTGARVNADNDRMLAVDELGKLVYIRPDVPDEVRLIDYFRCVGDAVARYVNMI